MSYAQKSIHISQNLSYENGRQIVKKNGKKFRKDYVFYQLNIEDIQTVATETYGRELTQEEIKNVLDPIADRIPWYDAIENAISATLDIEREEDDEDED